MAASQSGGTVSSLSTKRKARPAAAASPAFSAADLPRSAEASIRRMILSGCRRAWAAKISAEASVEPLSASKISHEPSQTWAVRLSSVSASVASPL